MIARVIGAEVCVRCRLLRYTAHLPVDPKFAEESLTFCFSLNVEESSTFLFLGAHIRQSFCAKLFSFINSIESTKLETTAV